MQDFLNLDVVRARQQEFIGSLVEELQPKTVKHRAMLTQFVSGLASASVSSSSATGGKTAAIASSMDGAAGAIGGTTSLGSGFGPPLGTGAISDAMGWPAVGAHAFPAQGQGQGQGLGGNAVAHFDPRLQLQYWQPQPQAQPQSARIDEAFLDDDDDEKSKKSALLMWKIMKDPITGIVLLASHVMVVHM